MIITMRIILTLFMNKWVWVTCPQTITAQQKHMKTHQKTCIKSTKIPPSKHTKPAKDTAIWYEGPQQSLILYGLVDVFNCWTEKHKKRKKQPSAENFSHSPEEESFALIARRNLINMEALLEWRILLRIERSGECLMRIMSRVRL